MSDWELIDSCAETGLRKWMGYDEATDSVLVSYEQDQKALKQLLDDNKRVQMDSWDRKEDMWHAAHIPIGIMYEWKVKHGIDAWDPNHTDGVKRLLNSDEYRYLRVRNFII